MARAGRCKGFCFDASTGGCVTSAIGCPTAGCPNGGCPNGVLAAVSCFDFGVLLGLRLRAFVESNPVVPAPEAGRLGETGASLEGRSVWLTMFGWRVRCWLRTP